MQCTTTYHDRSLDQKREPQFCNVGCYYLCLSRKAAMAVRPPLASSHPSMAVLEWESGHCGAPPLAPSTILLLHEGNATTLAISSRLGQPAAQKPQVIQIQSDLSISLVPRRTPWKIQSDLPHPSLLKSARASPVRSPLAFSRSTPGEELLRGS